MMFFNTTLPVCKSDDEWVELGSTLGFLTEHCGVTLSQAGALKWHPQQIMMINTLFFSTGDCTLPNDVQWLG